MTRIGDGMGVGALRKGSAVLSRQVRICLSSFRTQRRRNRIRAESLYDTFENEES